MLIAARSIPQSFEKKTLAMDDWDSWLPEAGEDVLVRLQLNIQEWLGNWRAAFFLRPTDLFTCVTHFYYLTCCVEVPFDLLVRRSLLQTAGTWR